MLNNFNLPPEFITWILIFSLIMFFGTLIAVPYLISIIPEDYFLHEKRESTLFAVEHPFLRVIFFLVKNILGITLIILGILLLVLPGQGILTIITGLIIMDFPNKYQLERRMARRPRILKTMNWFRMRINKTPLWVD